MRLARVVAVAAVAAALVLVARAAAPEHELRPGAPLQLTPGQKGAVSLTVAPLSGRRIDAEAPFSVRLSVAPAKGLKLPKKRYDLGDAADPRAEAPRFDLRVEAESPGDYVVTAEVRFWVCAKKTCRAVRDRAELSVRVSEPAPPEPPAGAAPPAPDAGPTKKPAPR